jgi:hypothetical protein
MVFVEIIVKVHFYWMIRHDSLPERHIDSALDKESTSYNDTFEAFRLALKFYHFEERRD